MITAIENAEKLLKAKKIDSGNIITVGKVSGGSLEYNYVPFSDTRDGSAILVTDFDNIDNPESVLENVRELAFIKKIPIIICCFNISYKEFAMNILEGSFTGFGEYSDRKFCRVYSPSSFAKITEKAFLKPVCECNVISENLEKVGDRYTLAKSRTIGHDYINWFKLSVDKYANTVVFVRMFEAAEKRKAAPKNKPFLSVLTRTQGKRPEALREAILTLSGQTCTDFELMIVAHNVEGDKKTAVEEIIKSQPEWLREKIRYIPVKGGTRTTPLNEGFKAAKGEYVAILDDDDIVFDNWVEEFKNAADKKPGTLLHAYTVMQDWMTVDTDEGISGLRACSTFRDDYCVKFDTLNQLIVNKCPPVGLAFPSKAFREYGLRFDETLNTTEDWDYLMRVFFLCGVTDITTPTCVYRIWVNAETSQTLHNEAEWRKNHLTIQRKFSECPVIISNEYVADYIRHQELPDNLKGGCREYAAENGNVYIDTGDGFSQNKKLQAVASKEVNINAECNELAKFDGVRKVRFDPCDGSKIMLSKFTMTAIFENGKKRIYSADEFTFNGKRKGERIFFKTPNPQFVMKEEFLQKPISVQFSFGFINLSKYIKHIAKESFIIKGLYGLYRKVRHI